jgi:ABC-type glycerol-3-phosphate transport system substrate-binding protein
MMIDHVLTRRVLLQRTSATALALTGTALLAACGGSGTATVGATTSAQAAGTTTAPATSAPTTSAAVTSAVTTNATTAATSSVAATSSAAKAAAAASTQAPAAAGKTISILWGNPQNISGYQAIWQQTFDAFQQSHPGMTIQPNWVANSDPYRPKLLTLIASGDPGDIFWTNNANAMHEFSARKISRPLDDLVSTAKFDLTQFYPTVIAMNRFQGKLYGMPQDSHPGIAGMFYDADSFQKVGAAAPTAVWT